MAEVEPRVVRIIDVPSGALLSELHDLLQSALGWTDSHLHQFVANGISYGMDDIEGPDDQRLESGVPLRTLLPRFSYLYDFGDGWEHEIELLGPGGEVPGCVDGQGACPPEDVGGPHGYAEFREALADRHHPESESMRTWAGAWTDEFDLAATDLLLRQTVGAVPAPVRLVLALADGGTRLTPGGRLSRAFVRQVQQSQPSWRPLERPAAIEDDLAPLAALHDLLRTVGLLTLRHGLLRPTRAGEDDVQVIRRLRSWFGPDHGFVTILVSESLASLATAGPCQPERLAARVFPLLGDRWVTNEGQPLTEQRVATQLHHLRAVLVGLDLIGTEAGMWSDGPSTRWLLPRATALARQARKS